MATITWPATIDSSMPDTAWRNDTSHSDGTEDGSDVVEGFHAAQHNKLALFMAAAENELGADPSATFTSVAARLNARLTCRTTADQALAANTTALTNVTNMVLPVATTGLDYYFKFLVAFSMATIATAGLRLGVTTPAITGYLSARVMIPRTADANPAAGTAQSAAPTVSVIEWPGYINSSGDSVVSDQVPATGTIYVATVEGILSNPSATGNIQLQASSEVTGSTLTIKRGSYGEIYIN